ncbi:ATP synthase subunit S, putative [Pediculus humanus corporis]|uniref:ATP synthase subunit S, putative n=1 Tax=Pediculus humanus subsp. corporis TaxID=121224 RepID=E0VV91_PEDHC|nr:ATP synthase subunit S, putative [Pediculus humanus corporis]EEB17297.1 ATP synthase subunit S, putative [Pediculus humanus corporis]
MEMEELNNYSKYKLEEIFAQKAGLSYLGFEHLKNCEHIKKIRLIACHFLNDQCLNKLSYVKNSLEFLEIRSSFLVHNKGILSLSQLNNLKTLILADLPEVEKKGECEAALKKALTNCKIVFE